MGSGDGVGTGSGGIGCGGNGSTNGDPVMESDSARQWIGMRSENTNWAVTAADRTHLLLRVRDGRFALQVPESDIVGFLEEPLAISIPALRVV